MWKNGFLKWFPGCYLFKQILRWLRKKYQCLKVKVIKLGQRENNQSRHKVKSGQDEQASYIQLTGTGLQECPLWLPRPLQREPFLTWFVVPRRSSNQFLITNTVLSPTGCLSPMGPHKGASLKWIKSFKQYLLVQEGKCQHGSVRASLWGVGAKGSWLT